MASTMNPQSYSVVVAEHHVARYAFSIYDFMCRYGAVRPFGMFQFRSPAGTESDCALFQNEEDTAKRTCKKRPGMVV